MDNAAQEKDTLGEDTFKALKGLSELSVNYVIPNQYLLLGVASKIGSTTVSKVDEKKRWSASASADSLSVVAAASIAIAALTMWLWASPRRSRSVWDEHTLKLNNSRDKKFRFINSLL